MKSELAAKPMRSELPWPSPVPRVPPEPNDIRDWAIWSLCAMTFGEKGFSQALTRSWTCGSKEATPTAPAPDISRPKTIQLVRSVATYRTTTNIPKNSIEVPRSVSKIRMSRLIAHTVRIGPRSRPRGRYSPMKRRLASASASLFTMR